LFLTVPSAGERVPFRTSSPRRCRVTVRARTCGASALTVR